MFKWFISILVFFPVLTVSAQEIEANVIINSEKIQTQERQVFEQMKRDITNFLNNRKWTEDNFQPEEKIKCTFFFTLMDGSVNSGAYKATLQVQSSRPVYGTNYETVLLNFLDKDFSFEYLTSQPMNYNENTFISSLTSTLGYYVNIILALDYDSFSSLGGTPYLEKARTILNAAVSSGVPGWSDNDPNSRFWLAADLNSQVFLPFREGLYTYHLKGLDVLAEKPQEGREAIFSVIEDIHNMTLTRASSTLLKNFFNAKADELVGVFSRGDMEIRQQVFDMLKELDPLNTEKYQAIVQ